MSNHSHSTETLDADVVISPWWIRILLAVVVFSTGVLIYITAHAYYASPPIPSRVIDQQGQVLSTREHILAGEQVFQRYGLMNNGSVWGHGAYLGPDYAAVALHREALILHEFFSRKEFQQDYASLDQTRQSAVNAEVAYLLKENNLDKRTDSLPLTNGEAQSWMDGPAFWKSYFHTPNRNGGLKPDTITNNEELRDLSDFFQWAAWASTAERPGQTYSYTNNFPYEPFAGNILINGATIWTALSIIILLCGIASAIYMHSIFPTSGWISDLKQKMPNRLQPGHATAPQRALAKFMLLGILIFFFQTILGGALAHYRINPTDFMGWNIAKVFPSNLLRSWHLQSAIFWIAIPYVAATLYLAIAMRPTNDPIIHSRALTWTINGLFVAFVSIVVCSYLGIWAGYSQTLGKYWELLGASGWEYMEQGEVWRLLLVIILFIWFGILYWLAHPTRQSSKGDKVLNRLFLMAALAIPVFYAPVLFIGHHTNFSIVETWRFWVVHLWMVGYLEFFITTLIAIMFYLLGITRLKVAIEVVLFDGILFFLGGILGTCHHWYFIGQGQILMAIGALISALQVVPLTLLAAEAWDFYQATQLDKNQKGVVVHDLTFFFLMASGFWNFLGAGVAGFFINLPIVSYYEVGTILTPNHAHASFMGVFGMLALAMISLVSRNITTDDLWNRIKKWFWITFWGTNIGLTLMCLLSLFPGGLLQMWDVINHGYWHARSTAYTQSTLAQTFEWLRFIGDAIFIVFGSVPLLIGAAILWITLVKRKWQNMRIERQRKKNS